MPKGRRTGAQDKPTKEQSDKRIRVMLGPKTKKQVDQRICAMEPKAQDKKAN